MVKKHRIVINFSYTNILGNLKKLNAILNLYYNL